MDGLTLNRAFLLAVIANVVGGFIVIGLVAAHARIRKEPA